MLQQLNKLYRRAIDIERSSQSPRLMSAHSQNQFCQVDLGIYYPESTKYMFVSRNPGGDPFLYDEQDAEKYCLEHPSFEEYINYTFPFARKMKLIISSFANKRGIGFDEALRLFGTTDLSFFHSKTSDELKESFFIEVKECLPVLLEELSIPKLCAIIFSGVPQEAFFYNLYKSGAPILNYNYKNSGQDWMVSFKTTLINNREYHIFFITHISGTRGLRNDSLISIGNELADILPSWTKDNE